MSMAKTAKRHRPRCGILGGSAERADVTAGAVRHEGSGSPDVEEVRSRRLRRASREARGLTRASHETSGKLSPSRSGNARNAGSIVGRRHVEMRDLRGAGPLGG